MGIIIAGIEFKIIVLPSHPIINGHACIALAKPDEGVILISGRAPRRDVAAAAILAAQLVEEQLREEPGPLPRANPSDWPPECR